MLLVCVRKITLVADARQVSVKYESTLSYYILSVGAYRYNIKMETYDCA